MPLGRVISGILLEVMMFFSWVCRVCQAAGSKPSTGISSPTWLGLWMSQPARARAGSISCLRVVASVGFCNVLLRFGPVGLLR